MKKFVAINFCTFGKVEVNGVINCYVRNVYLYQLKS